MNIAFQTGASGLVANQHRMDVIGNNIANVNTTDYRPMQTSFEELLNTEMYVNSGDILTGHGVKIEYTGIDVKPGTLKNTTRQLDLAINGEGWFAVERDGETLYTRNGCFDISTDRGTAYLVDQSGNFVLDNMGRRIATNIAAGSSEVDYAALVDKVGVYNFQHPQALTPAGSSCYSGNAKSGPATATADSKDKIAQGFLEQSGVSLPDEIVDLISTQRGYQLSARVLQTADEIEQTINSLRV